jgi:hypothetical protein
VKSLNNHFLSLKKFFDFFAHIPCSFSGEGESEDTGGVDIFLFDHVCYFCSYGRGFARACACKDQVGGAGLFD